MKGDNFGENGKKWIVTVKMLFRKGIVTAENGSVPALGHHAILYCNDPVKIL